MSSARRVEDTHRIARACSNLGGVYQNRGQFHAALDNYHQALVLGREQGDRTQIALALNNIGNLYHIQGDNVRALSTYEQALEDKERLGDDRSIAITLLNMGACLVKLGKFGRAGELLERAGTTRSEARTTRPFPPTMYCQGGIAHL